MDGSSTRVSTPESPDSPESSRSSDKQAKAVPSFECPSAFQQVDVSAQDQPLYLEDVRGTTELWLIKTPHNFDAKRLSTKNVSLNGRQFLDENEESDVSYELLASQDALSNQGLPHLLLPSRHGGDLVAAPTFKGQLSVLETVSVPSVLLPPSPPKRSTDLPPGLKQRFLPFGWEEPKKQITAKKSVDTTDSGVLQAEGRKKKKSHKDRTPVTSSNVDATALARQSDTQGDDERLSGGGEEGVGDEEGRAEKKEHRKSKKRKHKHDLQRDDAEDDAQMNSEQTPTKKKKKKHKK